MNTEASKTEIFNQKKVGHIFHYTRTIESLVGILEAGFKPSYCKEQIGDHRYLIPMVSFCNISIRDVDLYIRYGGYGIGMSISWALNNRISPVIYVHDKSPFNNLHSNINMLLLSDMFGKQFGRYRKMIDDAIAKGEEPKVTNEIQKDEDMNLAAAINEVTVPALQFFKNWTIEYDGREIITYQEREWRYIPELTNEKKIVSSSEAEFNVLIDEKQSPKPHLPKFALKVESIESIRYIIIKEDSERSVILECLKKYFDANTVINAIVDGKLMILTNEQIRNDF